MFEKRFCSNLTVRENLSLPLVFKAVEKNVRDEIVDKALFEQGLVEAANKFYRYLTEDEEKKVLIVHSHFWKIFPELEEFLNLLDNNGNARFCLPLIQHEIFMNISKDLRIVAQYFGEKDFDSAVRLLEESVDKLALRMILASFYENPSVRVMEVLLLVIRNYRDLFKYRDKMNSELLGESEERMMMDLKSLAGSFEELS